MADDDTHPLIGMVQRARRDRDTIARYYNEVCKYAFPERLRMNGVARARTVDPNSEQDQADLYDETLQITHQEWAIERMDRYTPSYDSWAQLDPGFAMPTEPELADAVDEFENELKAYKDKLFKFIGTTNYYESALLAMSDFGASAMAMEVHNGPGATAPACTWIPSASLLMWSGPDGKVDGRYVEQSVEVQHLYRVIGEEPTAAEQALWAKPLENKKPTDMIGIVRGYRKVWERLPDVVWLYEVICGDKVMMSRTVTDPGSCSIIVARQPPSFPSAWGRGPAFRALPSARVLDQYEYLDLRSWTYQVDPPAAVMGGRTVNWKNRIGPGQNVEVDDDFKWTPMIMERTQNLLEEKLLQRRQVIRRAYGQDLPQQLGKTPPTATQFSGESITQARREGVETGSVLSEWVVEMLQRFAFIMKVRGIAPDVTFKNESVDLKFVTPMTKARDLEKVQQSLTIVQGITAADPSGEAARSIDFARTGKNLAKRLNDEDVAFYTSEQMEMFRQAEMAKNVAPAITAAANATGAANAQQAA